MNIVGLDHLANVCVRVPTMLKMARSAARGSYPHTLPGTGFPKIRNPKFEIRNSHSIEYPSSTMLRIKPSALEQDLLLRGVWEGLGTPECLVTGGYVRDRLLGRSTVDLDLVLPGDLDDARGPARRLAARLDGSAHVLGRDEKRVWRIETPSLKVELWPLGDLDVAADIRRRDFSINALMWQLPDGPIIDQVGGIGDLKAGRIRAILKKNLQEDPVRLVRAARFLAQFGNFKLESRTEGWIRSLAPKVRRSPPERLGQEILKLVALPDRRRGVQALLDLGILQRMAGAGFDFDDSWINSNMNAVSRLKSYRHPLRAALAASGTSAALAVVLRAWGSPSPETIAHFAWPRPIRINASRAAGMLDEALVAVDGSAAVRRGFIHRAGTSFPTVVSFAAAVEPDRNWDRWWRQWRDHGTQLVNPVPLLTGGEVAHLLGVEAGPGLGRAVEALAEAQVRGEVRARNGAERWLRKWFKEDSPRLWEDE